MSKGFFFRGSILCQRWWILKRTMKDPGLPREARTGLSRMITDGNHVINTFIQKFLDMLGSMGRNIHPCFSHHPNRMGIKSMGFYTGRKHLIAIIPIVSGPAFGHLGTTGITGA
jgi:hypothetical protein